MIASLPFSTPTWPFPQATGRGLKIAVIDSGVHLKHPHIHARTHQVNWEDQPDFDGEDQVGHGTAVMAAIQEKAPEAEYFSLRLFGRSLRATSTQLMRAIDWAISNRMDIVNLSLGTPNPDARTGLEILLNRARSAGVVIVSARKTVGERCYMPGNLEGAIGVEVDWQIERDRYRISGAGEALLLTASGYPRPLPGMSPSRNLNGVSFAVANATGFIVRACEGLRDRSLERIEQAMAWEASRLS